jgi:hypothetical protein
MANNRLITDPDLSQSRRSHGEARAAGAPEKPAHIQSGSSGAAARMETTHSVVPRASQPALSVEHALAAALLTLLD